jgi:gliding motility-associated-like protein
MGKEKKSITLKQSGMARIFSFFLFFFLIKTNVQAQLGTYTWVHGVDTGGNIGNYGVKGMPADSNLPAARYQSAYWTDKQGNFWMFGGVTFLVPGYNEQNDMWKFTPSTNQWTWMNGPKFASDPDGEFGIKGISSPNNYPSIRGWGANCWTDTAGNLWLYGGYGRDSALATGFLSDLWKYNVTTNEWTWINGSSTIYHNQVKGITGLYADSITPGALEEVKSSWVDNKTNHFYMFGGMHYGINNPGIQYTNDLFEFNPQINQWRHVKGNSAYYTTGNFGTKGVEDTANYPPGRCSYTKWKDPFGDFYIFGGARFADTANLNDVWRYSTTSNAWTWMNGSSAKNVKTPYGPFCLYDSNNNPYPRLENQTAQNRTCVNSFWSFGGYDIIDDIVYNDLWVYNSQNQLWSRQFGKDTAGFAGVYGTKGVASPTNEIGARCGVAIWIGNDNNVYIFGGINHDVSNVNNDMWRYTPDSSCFYVQFKLPITAPLDSTLCAGDTTKIINLDTNWAVGIYPNIGAHFNADSSQLFIHPNVTTQFTLTAVDYRLADCVLPDSLFFTTKVDSLFVPAIANDTFFACPQNVISLPLDTSYYYTWTSGFLSTNVDTSLLFVNFINSNTYNYFATKKGVCSQTKNIKIVGKSYPPSPPILVTPTQTICAGDSLQIPISSAYRIRISPFTNVGFDADSSIVYFYPTTFSSYSIHVINDTAVCKDSANFVQTIFVNPKVQTQIGPYPSFTICVGDTIGIPLINNINYSMSPQGIYANGGTAFFAPNSTTIYTVMAINNADCSLPSVANFSISVLPAPKANFSFTPNYIVFSDNTNLTQKLLLENKSTDASKFKWFTGNMVFLDSTFNFQTKLSNPGKYCFVLEAANYKGCKDTILQCITAIEDTSSVLIIPNAFSPNADLINDDFTIIHKNIELLDFIVFNRWGNSVFASKSWNEVWRGLQNGKQCDAGTYFYMLKYRTLQGVEKVAKGDVTLIR